MGAPHPGQLQLCFPGRSSFPGARMGTGAGSRCGGSEGLVVPILGLWGSHFQGDWMGCSLFLLSAPGQCPGPKKSCQNSILIKPDPNEILVLITPDPYISNISVLIMSDPSNTRSQ